MSIRLSHSSINKYEECPKKWQLHYQEKLRTEYLNSPLFFGSALDDAFGRLHLDKMKQVPKEFRDMLPKSAETIFMENMQYTTFNKKKVYIPTYEKIRYSNVDFQEHILTEHDRRDIDSFIEQLGVEVESLSDFFETCKLKKRNREQLEEIEDKILKYISWISLCRKGMLLLDVYRKEVMPLIHTVQGIQVPISIQNDEDDTYIGYIDWIASFNDDPETFYVLDDKTSSKAYPKNAVEESIQLAGYTDAMELEYSGFVVAEKNIRKRDPMARVNILKGQVSDETFDATFDRINNTIEQIKAENFQPIINSGEKCMFFGRKCEYYSYCRDNSTYGLVSLKEV